MTAMATMQYIRWTIKHYRKGLRVHATHHKIVVPSTDAFRKLLMLESIIKMFFNSNAFNWSFRIQQINSIVTLYYITDCATLSHKLPAFAFSKQKKLIQSLCICYTFIPHSFYYHMHMLTRANTFLFIDYIYNPRI